MKERGVRNLARSYKDSAGISYAIVRSNINMDMGRVVLRLEFDRSVMSMVHWYDTNKLTHLLTKYMLPLMSSLKYKTFHWHFVTIALHISHHNEN